MKLTENQFEEAAYVIEKANGVSHSEYEQKIIAESEFKNRNTSELETLIVDGLNAGLYKTESERISAYWCLYKIGNPKLKEDFVNWLGMELKKGHKNTLFQLLVALDRIGEKAFADERTGRAADELDLNVRDAMEYLKNNSAQHGV